MPTHTEEERRKNRSRLRPEESFVATAPLPSPRQRFTAAQVAPRTTVAGSRPVATELPVATAGGPREVMGAFGTDFPFETRPDTALPPGDRLSPTGGLFGQRGDVHLGATNIELLGPGPQIPLPAEQAIPAPAVAPSIVTEALAEEEPEITTAPAIPSPEGAIPAPTAPTTTSRRRLVFAPAFQQARAGELAAVRARKEALEVGALERLKDILDPDDFALLAAGTRGTGITGGRGRTQKISENLMISEIVTGTDRDGEPITEKIAVTRDPRGNIQTALLSSFRQDISRDQLTAARKQALEGVSEFPDSSDEIRRIFEAQYGEALGGT